MTIQSLSVLKNDIGSIQLKLFDFETGEINFEEKIEETVFKEEKTWNINRNVEIMEDGHFQMIKPVCPSLWKC